MEKEAEMLKYINEMLRTGKIEVYDRKDEIGRIVERKINYDD